MPDLTYDQFRSMAADGDMSATERAGFPEHIRQSTEPSILQDWMTKMPHLNERGKVVVDLGCGCGPLTGLLMAMCEKHEHRLHVIDSAEVLNHLVDASFVTKWPGEFPDDHDQMREVLRGTVDVVLMYSVIHHLPSWDACLTFITRGLELLADDGFALIGDIPNISMQARANGWSQAEAIAAKPGRFDDGLMLGLVQRLRNMDYTTWVVPEAYALPLSRIREDILVANLKPMS